MPLKPDPNNPDLMVYVKHEYNLPKEWQGLTNEEKHRLNDALNLQGRFPIIDAIEAALKEKNA